MKYEFETIESLIRSAFDEKTRSSSSFEQFAQVRNAVASERDRIRNSFVLITWQIQDATERSCFVLYHQNRLTVLIDKLFRITETEKASKIAPEAFFLYDLLEQILKHIEEELPDYFDLNSKAPESLRSRVLKSISSRKTGDSESLGDLCIKEIVTNLQTPTSKPSHKALKYAERLVESLYELLGKGASEEDYQNLLVSLNFNSQLFLTYWIKRIRTELSGLESDAEKLERLALYLKELNQMYGGSMAFIHTAKSIKTQVGEWILEEINFLERKLDLTTPTQVTEKEQFKRDFKLEFDMSVAQFAFFIKAFIETGVIQNKNISELIRFLAKFVKTKRSENISYESFRMKYYNVESATKDAVRNLLHTAIGFINSN